MIQRFAQFRGKTGSRRGITVMLALWLNLVLLPCAMALEVEESGHDCCPQTIELQALDCCELDAVAPDTRDGKFDAPDDVALVVADTAWPSLHTLNLNRHLRKPPDPGNHSPPLHKLHCVYLK